MASTHKRRLSDFLKPFARSTTFDFTTMEQTARDERFALTASTAQDLTIFCANGPVAVQNIAFVPEIASPISGSAYWTLTFTDKGVTGAGATTLGTFTNQTGGTALVADRRVLVYNPASELILPDADVISLGVVMTGSPAALQGLLIVYYIQLMDA